MVCGKAIKALFKQKFYLPGVIVTSLVIFALLAFLQQFLFFNPFAFFVPQPEILMFSFVVTISVLAGLTIPMAFYKIFNYRFTFGSTRQFLGIVLGIAVGCGCSVGFSLIAVTGSVGSNLLGFLTAYQNYIMLSAIALLAYSFFAEMSFIAKLYCR